METFGNKLKFHREAKGLKANDLAKRLGVAPSSIVNWEKSYNNPRLDMIYKIAEVLDIDIFSLLSDDVMFQLNSTEKQLLMTYRRLPIHTQNQIIDYINYLFTKNQNYTPPPQKL